MSQQQSPYKNRGPVEVTSIATALAFSPPIVWVQIVTAGSGGLVVQTEDGVAHTYAGLNSGDVLYGPFAQLTSMTCTKIRYGDGQPPQNTAQANTLAATASSLGGVELNNGLSGAGSTAQAPILNLAAGNVSGVLVATSTQQFVDSTTIYTTGFTAVAGAVNPFNFQATGFNVTLPAVTAAMAGQALELLNNGTGATAVLALLGSAGGNVVLSGLWPTSLKAQRFVASPNLGGWIPG